MSDAGDVQAAASQRDHPYVAPPDEPWGLCVVCRLGQAAHSRVGVPYVPTARRAEPEREEDGC